MSRPLYIGVARFTIHFGVIIKICQYFNAFNFMYSIIVCRYLDSLTASELGGVDGDQLRGSIGTPHPKPWHVSTCTLRDVFLLKCKLQCKEEVIYHHKLFSYY